MRSLDELIDELFTAQPERFTDARNNLAKELKKEGDAEGGARVLALRKPVRSAWALNRLVHDDRAAVEDLLSAGERLRAAQVKALSRKGAPGLREAAVERDKLVNMLTRKGAQFLGDPSSALIDEIAATLEAASVDASAGRALLEARLSKPLPRPTGFGDVLGLKVAEDTGKKDRSSASRTRHRTPTDHEIRVAERRAETARERVRRLRVELAGLKDRVDQVDQQLRAAEADAQGRSRHIEAPPAQSISELRLPQQCSCSIRRSNVSRPAVACIPRSATSREEMHEATRRRYGRCW